MVPEESEEEKAEKKTGKHLNIHILYYTEINQGSLAIGSEPKHFQKHQCDNKILWPQ